MTGMRRAAWIGVAISLVCCSDDQEPSTVGGRIDAAVDRGSDTAGAMDTAVADMPTEVQSEDAPEDSEPADSPAEDSGQPDAIDEAPLVDTGSADSGADEVDAADLVEEPLPGEGLELVALGGDGAEGLVCADGSGAGYYWRRSASESAVWVIHLEGDGFCYNDGSCAARLSTAPEWMSSNGWPAARAGRGLLSPSPTDNPDFYDANHVLIRDCSGDLFAGDLVGTSDSGLRFRGGAILRAVIDRLADKDVTPRPNLSDASSVLFSGTGAGGLGVLAHLDWLEGLLDAKVRGLTDAGWLMRLAPVDLGLVPVTDQVNIAYSAFAALVDDTCAISAPLGAGDCFMADTIATYLDAELMVVMAQADPVQLALFGVSEPFDAGETSFIETFKTAVRDSFGALEAGFSPAGALHGLVATEQLGSVAIDGRLLRDVIGDWFFTRGGELVVVE